MHITCCQGRAQNYSFQGKSYLRPLKRPLGMSTALKGRNSCEVHRQKRVLFVVRDRLLTSGRQRGWQSSTQHAKKTSRHQAQNEEDLFSPQSLFNHQESWARSHNMSRHQKFVFFWQKTMMYSLMLVLAFFSSKQNIWIGLVWGTVTSCYPILEQVNAHRAINHHTRKSVSHNIYEKRIM